VGLDLWFREDVARILAAMFEAMQGSQAATQGGGNADYQQGFEDALRAVGVAFGVAAPRATTTDSDRIGTNGAQSGVRIIDVPGRNQW